MFHSATNKAVAADTKLLVSILGGSLDRNGAVFPCPRIVSRIKMVLPVTVKRDFSIGRARSEKRDMQTLPDRIMAHHCGNFDYVQAASHFVLTNSTLTESKKTDLLSLRWPRPPRNVLLVRKSCATTAKEALTEFAR